MNDSSDSERAALRQGLRASRHVVQIARLLLRYCRTHESEILAADNDSLNITLSNEVYDDASDLFEGIGEIPSREAKERIARLLVDGDPPLYVRAHAMAQALDMACHRFFPGFFRDLGTMRLEADDAYPLGYPDYRNSIGADRLISLPPSLPQRPDQMPHLRLGRPEDVSRFDIEFDFRAAAHLCTLGGPQALRVATCHPTVSLADLVLPDPDPDGRFFGVTPRNSHRQSARVSKLLQKAAELGANVVVFPELTMDESAWRRLEEEFRAGDDGAPPILLVAGSRHLEDQGARRNLSVGWVKGFSGSFDAQKFWPYKYREGETIVTEGIHREKRARVSILSTGSWACSIAICRDLLDQDRADLMVRLGINLLLVPAMSPKLGTFEGRISSHVAGTQGFAALANTPVAWETPQEEVTDSGAPMPSGRTGGGGDVPVAVFGQPIANDLLIRIFPKGGEPAAGIAFHDPSARSTRWHETDVVDT